MGGPDSRTRKPRGTSGRTVAALILAGVGAVLSAAGVATFVGFSRLLDADRARIEALRGLDAAALETIPPGTAVLLEGTVSRSQPAAFRDFVAYERQQRERKEETPRTWVTRARDTPPLTIDLRNGAARIVNAGYSLSAPVTTWVDPRVVGRTETRYVGLVAGEPVVVLGKAAVGGVAADFVTPGTRASYLAAKAESRLVARWLGGGLGGVGGLLLLIAVVLVATRPR